MKRLGILQKKINKQIDSALSQIDKNEYFKELIDNKIKPEKRIKLAIVFAEKEPYISRLPEK